MRPRISVGDAERDGELVVPYLTDHPSREDFDQALARFVTEPR